MQKEAQKADAAERPRVSPCWSCQGPVPGEALFCHTCQAVQPPGGDAPGTPYWRQTDAGWELVV